MNRPFMFAPATGQAMTLGDLIEFVSDARAAGIPETAQVRATGMVEINLSHGPRIARLTVLPEEATP